MPLARELAARVSREAYDLFTDTEWAWLLAQGHKVNLRRPLHYEVSSTGVAIYYDDQPPWIPNRDL